MNHADRGAQYASSEYVSVLQERGIRIGWSRTGNPYDNAKAERFMRTLKYGEVYRNDYYTLSEVQTSVRQFIDEVCNRKRPHSALSYVPPAEYDEELVFTRTLP